MLDEAIAQYAIERDGILNELHPYAGDYPDTSISWHRERDRMALDAAVRDAMLAAANSAGHHAEWSDEKSRPIPCQGCDLCTTRAQIDRLLQKGSEGGKHE